MNNYFSLMQNRSAERYTTKGHHTDKQIKAEMTFIYINLKNSSVRPKCGVSGGKKVSPTNNKPDK